MCAIITLSSVAIGQYSATTRAACYAPWLENKIQFVSGNRFYPLDLFSSGSIIAFGPIERRCCIFDKSTSLILQSYSCGYRTRWKRCVRFPPPPAAFATCDTSISRTANICIAVKRMKNRAVYLLRSRRPMELNLQMSKARATAAVIKYTPAVVAFCWDAR